MTKEEEERQRFVKAIEQAISELSEYYQTRNSELEAEVKRLREVVDYLNGKWKNPRDTPKDSGWVRGNKH